MTNVDNPLIFFVSQEEAGRADHIVGLHFPDASRKSLTALFAASQVLVDGKKVKKGHIVRAGQAIRLKKAPATKDDFRVLPEEDSHLVVLHEDEQLLILSKPAGSATHPLLANELGTLANALVHRFPECANVGDDPREAGLAHRLDIHTSGVIAAARTQEAWQSLRNAFSTGQVTKKYLAAVHDRPIGVECEEPLLQDGKRVRIDYAGLEAHTTWQLLSRTENYAQVLCAAQSGRMHQVRAHLAHCGSPIVGDTLYGGTVQEGMTGHFLHAQTLTLPHPKTGETMTFEAAIPIDRLEWLQAKGLVS